MSPQRLFVDELMSIGLVDRGDNPAATVEVWKRRDPQHSQWAAEQHARLDALSERLDTIQERRTRTTAPAVEKEETPMPIDSDVAKGLAAHREIESLAKKMVEADPSLHIAKARHEVRKAHPDLARDERDHYDPEADQALKAVEAANVTASRVVKARAGKPAGGSLAERANAAIEAKARSLSREPAMWDRPLHQLRREVRARWPEVAKIARDRSGSIVKADLDPDTAAFLDTWA